jgi:hypothetical protein
MNGFSTQIGVSRTHPECHKRLIYGLTRKLELLIMHGVYLAYSRVWDIGGSPNGYAGEKT